MILFPNAKINLGLHVVEKRSDGFHNIETLFYPIPFYDILEIVPTEQKGIEFTITGMPVPGEKASNLVMKAVNMITDNGICPSPDPSPTMEGIKSPSGSLGVKPGLRIHLHKAIPAGAGLGGGSSDGAFTLKLINDLLKFDLPADRLEELAGRLGSDSPFFIRNRPVLATGRGELLEPVTLDLMGYRIVLVCPPVQVSTREAYSMIVPRKPDLSLKEICARPMEEWKDLLTNDFEEPVMNRYSSIREVKERLYRQGAVYASMSGSGAAVYGIFSPQSAVPGLQLAGRSFPSEYLFFTAVL